MIDISHGALPSEEEMKRQLDFLALWKTNQLYLYSEASIELDGYPLLRPEGRMSKDEVRRIIEYGRERHIDIIPNIELYGHLHDLFRIEKYSELSDMPHGIEFDPRNPEVMPLLADWVNQYSTLFPSPFVHIGFDETFQIVMASQKKGDAAAPISLFVKQLNDVARLFEQRGKHVLAFADIMLEYPQIISALPSGLIAVPWHYKTEPNDREYKEFLGPLVAKGIPHFVEPGVTSWGTITPDFATTFENIDTFITAGRKSKAQGVITAVWMDKGQMLLRMSMPGMAYGAAAAWQSRPMDRAKFFSDYTRLIYPAGIAIDVAAALEALSESEAMLQATLGDYTLFALWEDPFFPAYLKLQPKDRANLRHVRLLAEDAQKHLQRALDSGTDPTLLSSFLLGSRLLDYAGQKFQTPPEVLEVWKRLGPRRPEAERFWNEWESIFEDHSRFVSLMDAITELRSLYREEWLAQYRPYRLGTALGRWDAEYEYWLRFQQRMKEFSDSTHEGDPLPPLETFSGRH